MSEVAFVALMYGIASVVLCGLALPMMLRKVPPNAWYGFRTPSTLRKPELWYDTNATAGRGLFITGAISLIATIVLGALISSIDLYAMLILAVTMGGIIITLVYTWRKHLA